MADELSIDQQRAVAMASARMRMSQSDDAPEKSSALTKDAAAMEKLGGDDPNYEYGDILPFKKNLKTGERSFAMPEMLRSPIRGTGDLITQAQNKSTDTSPDAVNAMMAMGGGFKPASEALTKGAEAAVHPFLHPVDTAGKVVDTAVKVSKSALSPVVKPVVRGVLDSDNSMFGGGLKTALNSPEAKEGERLGKKMGVNFSAGELTGNKTARNIEDALANSAKWSSKFTEANNTKTDAIVGKFKETLDKISSNSASQTGLGEKIASAYKQTINSLADTRRAQAKVDFERAETATGGNPVIAPDNFIKALSDYVKEGKSLLATPAQRAASTQAEKFLNGLKVTPEKPSVILDASGKPIERPTAPQYKRITVRDLQNGLAAFGEGAKSPQGGIWKGLATASDRRFSRAAKAALDADLDAAADSGEGEGASALKIARDHYKQNSAKIGDIQQTALGKIVGGAERNSKGELVISPEKMSNRFLSMDATEIKNTLKFLDDHHPDVAQMARRYTLEAAFRKASEGSGQRGAGMTKDFGMAEFVKGLPSDDRLTAILGDSSATKDVKDVAAAMNRLIDYGAKRSGSATAQRTQILDRLSRWGFGALYRGVVDDTLAEDLLNPQFRKSLAGEARKLNQSDGQAQPK